MLFLTLMTTHFYDPFMKVKLTFHARNMAEKDNFHKFSLLLLINLNSFDFHSSKDAGIKQRNAIESGFLINKITA